MDIGKAREKYIFTTKIELEDGEYLVLREPTSLELKDFGEDGRKNVEVLQAIFPKAIVEHSFTDGDKPAKATQVAAFILDSGTLFSKVIATWMESIPLNEKKSSK